MPTQEQRQVASFNRIALSGYGEIILTQGETESLVIETEPGALEKLRSEVRNGTLELKITSWWNWIFSSRPPIKYFICVRQLEALTISGSGSLQCAGLKTDALRLLTSGSSQIDIEPLEARELEIRISGSGKAGIAGCVDALGIFISGSAKILAPELKAKTADVHISGSGEIVVNPAEKLDVHISGSGSVSYFGQPKVTQHISGSGSIQTAG
jgi:hypothetical protein